MADGSARRDASGVGIRLVFDPEIDTQTAENMAASVLGGRPQALDENSTLGHPLSSLIGSDWGQLAYSVLQDEGVQAVLSWQVVQLWRGADGAQLVLVPNRLHWDGGRFKNQAEYRVVHIYRTAQPVVPSGYTAQQPPPAAPAGPGAIYIGPPPLGPPPVLNPAIGPNSAEDAIQIGLHGEVLPGGNQFFGQQQQPAPPNYYGGGPGPYYGY